MIRRFLYVLCIACLGAAPRQPGITAEKWLNRLTIRHGDQTHVILFFDTAQPRSREDHRALQEDVERLNKLARRSDVLVLGVMPEREEVARLFLTRYRPRFAIGVQSGSYRSFGVTRFPAVVVIKGETRQAIDDWNLVEQLLGPEPEGSEIPPEELTIEELQARIEKDGYSSNSPLDILRIRMEPEEFLQYCDQLEQKNGPYEWLGNLHYQRHLADPRDPVKQPPTTPSIDARREARRNGTRKSREWKELLATKESWSNDEILELYLKHSGDAPEDLVYRTDLAIALGDTREPRYAYALLDMLEMEPDPGIRSDIAWAIEGVHVERDIEVNGLTDHVLRHPELEVIQRLEACLATEDNVRWARPALESVVEYLRDAAEGSETPR